jgi:hypothetical protein
MRAFYEAAGYVGHVDVGVAVQAIEGATPYTVPFGATTVHVHRLTELVACQLPSCEIAPRRSLFT